MFFGEFTAVNWKPIANIIRLMKTPKAVKRKITIIAEEKIMKTCRTLRAKYWYFSRNSNRNFKILEWSSVIEPTFPMYFFTFNSFDKHLPDTPASIYNTKLS